MNTNSKGLKRPFLLRKMIYVENKVSEKIYIYKRTADQDL